MAHKFRPGDRVRLLGGWHAADEPDSHRWPRTGDVGTFVGGFGNHRVVYDRPATQVPFAEAEGDPGRVFNGKQSWGAAIRYYHYLGWRANPDKV